MEARRLSYRHSNRKKAKKASRDLLTRGATMAQLDRLFAWQLVSHRVYDRLINPLLDQPIGKAGKRKRVRSVPLPVFMEESA